MQNRHPIPQSLVSLTALLAHTLAVPAMFLVTIIIYQSNWAIEYLDMGIGRLTLNTLMLMCIIIGVYCASRIPMTIFREPMKLNWIHYILWSLAEILVTALFMGLYMALMYKHTQEAVGNPYYFHNVGKCLLLLMTNLIFPGIFVDTLLCNFRDEANAGTADSLLRFVDYTKRLKLTINADTILYARADVNYVHINYIDGDKIKEYGLRNSMRAIEPIMTKAGFVRCHRSFFVNPKHVSVLRKDKEGMIVAELDTNPPCSLPVSPKYYDSLDQLL